MKKRPYFLLSIFCLLALLTSGCSSYYFTDRGNDAADIMTASAGKGWGIKTRLGPLYFGFISQQDTLGLRGGEFFNLGDLFSSEEPPCRDVQLLIGGSEVFDTRHVTGEVRQKHFKARGKFIVQSPQSKIAPDIILPPTGIEYYSQLELALGLHGAIRIGINPLEIVDFICGLATVDILNDDLGRLKGNLKFHGRIVDENGELLNDVQMRTKTMAGRALSDNWNETSKISPAEFELQFVDKHRVAIEFSHPNYESVVMKFDLALPSKNMQQSEKHHFQTNQTIVMKKTAKRKVEERRLEREKKQREAEANRKEKPLLYNVKLTWDPQWGGSVWGLGNLGDPVPSDWEKTRILSAPGKGHSPRIYLQPIGVNGIEISPPANKQNGLDGFRDKVKAIRLTLDDEQPAGFSPVTGYGRSPEQMLQVMRDNSDIKYQPYLEIPANAFNQNGIPFENTYFNIKTATHYGVGYIHATHTSRNKMFQVAIRVYMMKDKTK